MISKEYIQFSYNDVVFNEVTHILMKKGGNIDIFFEMLCNERIIFEIIDEQVIELSKKYIKQYALRQNDALILATCKHYGIKYLATLDEDLIEPAKKEKIKLIMKSEDVEKIK